MRNNPIERFGALAPMHSFNDKQNLSDGLFCSRNRMLHGDGSGNRTETAWDRGDGIGLDRFIVDIAAQVAVLVKVDTNVQNRLTFAEARCIKGTCATRCANNDVCRAHDLGQVLRAGMADGHAGITAKQQHGNRLAHHKTATNNPLQGCRKNREPLRKLLRC